MTAFPVELTAKPARLVGEADSCWDIGGRDAILLTWGDITTPNDPVALVEFVIGSSVPNTDTPDGVFFVKLSADPPAINRS